MNSPIYIELTDKPRYRIIDSIYLKNDLLAEVLSESSKERITRNYKGTYFTGDNDIDNQIIGAMLSLNKGSNFFDGIENYEEKDDTQDDNFEKLLFILKKIISKEGTGESAFVLRMNNLRICKENIKSTLLTAVDKYNQEDLKKLFYFSNITFDILEKLNGFDSDQRNKIVEIMDLLKNEVGTHIFPVLITPNDLNNIKNNILSLKKEKIDNSDLLSEDVFNACLLSNIKSSTIDLLSLPSKYFKIAMKSIGDDINTLSFGFLGASNYHKLCDELKKRKLSDDKICQILSDFKYHKSIEHILFFIDKGLPLEKIKTIELSFFTPSYNQCSYIYDHITQNPDQLIKLLEFKYDTLLYIYNNITNDVNEIINDYFCLKNIGYDDKEKSDEVKNYIEIIFESIKKHEGENNKEGEIAKILFKRLINNFGERLHYESLYGNIAFFCEHFTEDMLNRLKKDEFKDFLTNDGFLKSQPKNANLLEDNFYTSATFLKGQPENFKFFYETGLFTTISDFNNYFLLFYMQVDVLKYLYEKGICTTKEGFIKVDRYCKKCAGTILGSQFDNIKYIYENGIFTTLDELLNEEDLIFVGTRIENIQFLYENNICHSIDEFKSVGESLGGDLDIKEFLHQKGICTSLNDFIELGKSKTVYADFDIIKYAYQKGICTSLNDFIKLGKTLLISAKAKNFKYVHKKGICTSLDDFLKNDHIITYGDKESLSILKELHNDEENYDKRVDLFGVINGISCKDEYKNEIIHKVGHLPIETAKKYVKICEIFDNSNSPDIQAVKDLLIMDVLNTQNPEEIVKKIDTIFMESNLPIISKIFQIFKYVYSKDIFENKLNENSSHYLQSCNSYEKKLDIIYKDLMHIMIQSGESSLKDFILSIISCKKALYDFENGKDLDKKGREQVLSLMKKIVSLNAIINGNGNKNTKILKSDGDINIETLKIYYNSLRKSLLIEDQDSIYKFFLNLCKKIGYSSLEDIIIDMNKSQIDANNNGLNTFNEYQKGETFHPSNNYFLKGIHIGSLGEILNRGVSSTEYLGGGEGTNDTVKSNGTPFDTDGALVCGENIFEVAQTHGYGDLDIIINTDKPGFYNTDTGLEGYNPSIYEVFKNHGDDSNFYGIRTGIASTEFDAIIYASKNTNLDEIQKIKYLITKNGFYLPIFDLDKNLLFTPQEYHRLRESFSFSEKYQGCDVEQKEGVYITTRQTDVINKGDEEFNTFIQGQKNSETSNRNIDNGTTARLVFDKIKNILESELGIKCNQNKNLLGAELCDSGSTGRGTEIPSNDIDLDFTLLLNSEDYKNLDLIKETIHKKIGTTESTDHSTVDGNGWQIKSSANTLGIEYGYEKGIRFDLLILKKTKSYLYPSNIAMQDRLQKVEELYDKDTLDFVKENIVIMKKLLKSQGTYKNTEGGMGGIGVENRIMQHHGNFIEALEAFEQVAYGGQYEEGKTNIPFEEFKKLYTIWDSGQNFKDNNNDNYIEKMNESGYNGILNIIKKYRTGGLNGISELIQNYEENKAEFIK